VISFNIRCGLSLLALVLTVAPAQAQLIRKPAPRAGTVEFSGGGLFVGGSDQPNLSANLTRNPTTGSGPLELFKSDVELRPGFGIEARVGVYINPAISVEGGVQVAWPQLRAKLSGDFEGAPDVTATETLTSYVFSGSVLYHFGDQAKRSHPFVLGGLGHVRDLHAGNDLVETGLEYHGGGGIKWWLGKGRPKSGIRADAGVSVREGGYGTEDGHRIVPTASFSFLYLF
jgi:hypothetical protein